MNAITISGRVATEPKVNGSTVSFALSVYDGKDENGKAKSFLVNIKIFHFDTYPTKGSDIIAFGRFRKYDYQGKSYCEIVCNQWEIGAIRRSHAKDSSEVADEGIPF